MEIEVQRQKFGKKQYNNPLLEAAASSFVLQKLCMAIPANCSTYSTSGTEDFRTEINTQWYV